MHLLIRLAPAVLAVLTLQVGKVSCLDEFPKVSVLDFFYLTKIHGRYFCRVGHDPVL